MKYRKKPVVIEAIRFSNFYDHTLQEAKDFVGDCWKTDGKVIPQCYIATLEGDMEVTHGDYIIKGVQGEFYPCKPDIFEATYEAVEDCE